MHFVLRFRHAFIAVLWTLSISLMGYAVADGSDVVGQASVLVGLLACVPTGLSCVDYVVRRARDETIEVVCDAIGYAEADAQVPRLR